MLALGNPDSWSLKYNMVWDTVAGFNLCRADVRETGNCDLCKAAHECIRRAAGQPQGIRRVRLDAVGQRAGRRTDENTRFMCRLLTVFLDNTRDRVPFTDWFENRHGHMPRAPSPHRAGRYCGCPC